MPGGEVLGATVGELDVVMCPGPAGVGSWAIVVLSPGIGLYWSSRIEMSESALVVA